MNEFRKINWRENPLEDDSYSLSEQDHRALYIQRITGGLEDAKDLIETIRGDDEADANAPLKIPGDQYYFKCKLLSCLNQIEHVKLINRLKIACTGRTKLNVHEKADVEFYNNVKQSLSAETTRFLAYAEDIWKKTLNRKPMNVRPAIYNYAKFERARKLKRVFELPVAYQEVDQLSYSYTDADTPIEMTHVANVFDVGKVAKFNAPDMTQQYFMKIKSLPGVNENVYNSKLPVSMDRNIDAIVANNEINAVISLSGLKRLIDFTDANQFWDLPVVVKEILNSQGEKRKVIFFDKPLPKRHPNRLELNNRCAQLLARTNFCGIEGFSYPSEDILLAAPSNECDSENAGLQSGKPVILHNASYKIWTLEQKDEHCSLVKRKHANRTFRVLVRTKLDGSEISPQTGTLFPVIVQPKLEYQLQFGAEICSKSELVHQWAALFFRPYSQLYRVRAHYYTFEVVKIEPCNVQKINAEAAAHHHGYKPHLGLGVLYKMLHELAQQPPGNYLLHHEPKHGAFVALMHETQAGASNAYNLHESYTNESKINDSYLKPWTPIDTNVLLPKFEAMGHMPGLFRPKQVQHKKFVGKFAGNKSQQKWKKKKKKKNAKQKVAEKVM